MLKNYEDGDVTLHIDDMRYNIHKIMYNGEVVAEVNLNRRKKSISLSLPVTRYKKDRAITNSIFKITHDIILNSDFRMRWKSLIGIKSDFILTEDGLLLSSDEAREMSECGLEYAPTTAGEEPSPDADDTHDDAVFYRSSSNVKKSVSYNAYMDYPSVRMTSIFPLDVRRFDDFKNTTLAPKCSINLAKHHVRIEYDLDDANTKVKSRKLSVPKIHIANRESERTVEATIRCYHKALNSNSALNKVTMDLFNIGDHVDILDFKIPLPDSYSAGYREEHHRISNRMVTSLESIRHSLKKKIMIPRNTHHEIIGGMIDYELANHDGPPHIEIESLFRVNNGRKLEELYDDYFGLHVGMNVSVSDTLKHYYKLRRMIRKIRKTMEKKKANIEKYVPDYMR